MYKNLFYWLSIAILLPSCSKSSPNISAVCEENYVGNCIIKWETSPTIPGQVKVYSSLDPNFIPETNPIASAPITDGKLTVITNNPTQRYYYSLVFDNKYRVKLASRNVNIPGIQNFRDVGGYSSAETGKVLKWGKLYRSAKVESPKRVAVKELNNIGIKTYVDLRTQQESNNVGDSLAGAQLIRIPISLNRLKSLLEDIQRGVVDGNKVDEMVKLFNAEIVKNNPEQFRQLFDVLLERDNYQIGRASGGERGSDCGLIWLVA